MLGVVLPSKGVSKPASVKGAESLVEHPRNRRGSKLLVIDRHEDRHVPSQELGNDRRWHPRLGKCGDACDTQPM